MDWNLIYDGLGLIQDWITGVPTHLVNIALSNAGNVVNYTTDWFSQVGASVGSSIASVVFYPFLAILSFLSLALYLFYLLTQLCSYLMAPIWFILNFLTGLWAAIQQNYSIVYLDGIFTDNAINNFIAAIPGYDSIMIIINASLWVILSLHIVAEIKKI